MHLSKLRKFFKKSHQKLRLHVPTQNPFNLSREGIWGLKGLKDKPSLRDIVICQT